MKGIPCYFVKINTENEENEIFHSLLEEIQFLPADYQIPLGKLFVGQDEVDIIQTIIKDFLTQNLIPYFEHELQSTRGMLSSKKGITGRIFGAGKRLFGGARIQSPIPHKASSTSIVALSERYTNFDSSSFSTFTSSELASKRVLDFAFILRDFKSVNLIGESLRKEFHARKQYKLLAGTLEILGWTGILTDSFDFTFFDVSAASYLLGGHFDLLVRVSLVGMKYLESMRDYKKCFELCARFSLEESCHPNKAFFTMKAGLYSIEMDHHRKAGFYLMKATKDFSTLKMPLFSLLCLHVLSESEGWQSINEAVRVLKVEQYSQLDMPEIALEHCRELVNNAMEYSIKLSVYFNMLLQIISKAKGINRMIVNVPRINQVVVSNMSSPNDTLFSTRERVQICFKCFNPISERVRYSNFELELSGSIFIASNREMHEVDAESFFDVFFDFYPEQSSKYVVERVEFLINDILPVVTNVQKVILVEDSLPLLDCQLLDSKEVKLNSLEMISGEVRECWLELKNMGDEITSVSVTPNLPQFILIGEESSCQDNRILTDFKQNLLSEPMTPDSEIRFRILLRADKIGEHTLDLLFEYRSKPEKVRTKCLSISLNVKSGLKINALSRNSTKAANVFLLNLEIRNNMSAEVEIKNIKAVSFNWKLDIDTNALVLNSDDSFYTLGRFSLYRESNCTEIKTNELLSTYILSGEFNSESRAIECNLDTLLMRSRNGWRKEQLQSLYPSVPVQDLIRIFPLMNSDDVDLIIEWQNSNAKGFHYVKGINLGYQRNLPILDYEFLLSQIQSSLYSQSIADKKQLIECFSHLGKEESPLKVHIDYCDSMVFSSPCIVEPTLTLKNMSKDTLDYNFQFLQGKGFTWIGRNLHNGSLAPLQTFVLKAKVCIPKPGFYDLSSWKIQVAGKNTFIQIPNTAHYLTVH